MARLLDLSSTTTEEAGGSRAMLHYGFTDMAGQLRNALDCFPGVCLVPFWTVVALVIVYLLPIGPGDYFLLRRFLRRMQWTWVSFPLVVLLVAAGALVWPGHQGRSRAGEPGGPGRRRRRLGPGPRHHLGQRLQPPDRALYDLAVAAAAARRTMVRPKHRGPNRRPRRASLRDRSWLGLPGEALGGMNPRASDPTVWKGGYRLLARPGDGPRRADPDLVDQELHRPLDGAAAAFVVPEAKLVEEDRVPIGTLTNPFDFPLHDCLLAYGNWVYELGESGTSSRTRRSPSDRCSCAASCGPFSPAARPCWTTTRPT